ncbi:acetylserotonin O-methyltransferase [Oligoflexia bacterium]|nr:acetylserotonin O-methyltransferase [Oligoflexia bacterium]
MSKDWSSEELLELAWSFQHSCILSAAAELDLFTALEGTPLTASALAATLNCDLRATTILLDALVALEVLDKDAETYQLPSKLSALLSESSAENVLPMIRHLACCERRWVELARVVKSGVAAQRVPSIRGEEKDKESFIGAMHVINEKAAPSLIAELGALQFEHLLDIGGASGTWTLALLDAHPNMQATIFDLPDVIPMSKKRISETGLKERVSFVAGDFYEDELPTGTDLAWLSAIAHQNSREQNHGLYAKIYRALNHGGTLLIRDVVMDTTHTKPPRGAFFAINMLVATEGGGTFTFEEYRKDLEACGFSDIELVREDPFMNSIIRAVKT